MFFAGEKVFALLASSSHQAKRTNWLRQGDPEHCAASAAERLRFREAGARVGRQFFPVRFDLLRKVANGLRRHAQRFAFFGVLSANFFRV